MTINPQRPGLGLIGLDDGPEAYAALDPSGLGARLRDLPRQCQAAWTHSQSFDWSDWSAWSAWTEASAWTEPSNRSASGWLGDIDQVVIGGMGGSAIAGDLVADLASLKPTVPVLVVRNFQLPFALNRRSLFIGCSYSGNTEESRSLFRQAISAGAQVLAVTGGGMLAKEARSHNIPVLTVDASGEPRSAIGYNLLLLLGLLSRLGLVSVGEAEVQAAIKALDRQLSLIGEAAPTPENPAKMLARELLDKLVVVYGGGIFSGAACRWKAQLNENAKVWAFYETIPESLHNSVEAYGGTSRVGKDVMALVLDPVSASAELKARYRTLAEMLRWGNIDHRVLPGTDGPPLAQLLSMIMLGDYVSYYLALLQGIDPSPTPAIVRSKGLLDQLGQSAPDRSTTPS
jgi:glucose/mannose-6-phosphate isomerase